MPVSDDEYFTNDIDFSALDEIEAFNTGNVTQATHETHNSAQNHTTNTAVQGTCQSYHLYPRNCLIHIYHPE
jgi:hypothetical protein